MENYVKQLFEDNELVELRVMCSDYVTAGLYDNSPDLIKMANHLKKDKKYLGIYTTLNRPNGQYFTYKNQLNAKTRSVKDQDITRITRIPFDFDPIRDKGVNATQHQLDLSLQSAQLLLQWLKQLSWPAPLIAMSGNGAHLQYRCDIEPSHLLAQAMTIIYQSLHQMFKSDCVSFDQTVLNPSRIFRLYGTINRKAPAGKDTPQRLANYLMPNPYHFVKKSQIFSLANYLYANDATIEHLKKPATLKPARIWSRFTGDYRTLDIVNLMTDLGLYKRSMGMGKHVVYCPWATQHSTSQKKGTSDTIVWEKNNDAWPQFHCSHNSCTNKNIVRLIQHVGVHQIVSYCTE